MVLILLILFSIISLWLLFWQISNFISVFYGSPYVMVDKIVIQRALKLANLKKGEVFYDLGCGRGDVLIKAGEMGAKAIGFEISPYYYLYAKIRIGILKLIPFNCSSIKKGLNPRRVTVFYKNIYKTNLSKADVVYCYLLPKMLEKLTPKFKKELKKGGRLISIGFPLKFENPCRVIKMKKSKIYGHWVFIYRF